ncbi:MAG TPA: MaoC/PaaZ C-terminal domain-containing protein [Alphaproteobacteria bacterium]|jgi:acyl dehydratase|nr:MaoC/PaaZ C-terminal domain-containing protein [Alphaproteobacteria bacterium]
MTGTGTAAKIDYRDVAAMRAAIDAEFTPWSTAIEVTQDMIEDFARLSGDDYWIHTDVERARRESPYGTTIAHGMLVQSLVGRLHMKMPFEVAGFRNMVNYGSSRLRFPTPVPAGSFIHARSRVKQVKSAPLGTLLTLEIHIHVVGNARPSVTNEVLILYM